MRFSRILKAVTSEPWLILPAYHSVILQLVEAKIAGMDLAIEVEDPEAMQISNGVAIIPIKGVVGKGLSALEKSCGAVGVEDVSANLAMALEDETVESIVLDIDSPGGTVSGVPELADAIAAADERKPVIAFTDGQMDSAAYWLASGARAIVATPSAEVGSIGVYMPWVDSTMAYQMEGYQVEVIKNTGGTFKGMGLPGTKLTEEQRTHLQERVDDIFNMFVAAVTKKRKIAPGCMRGQTMMGAKALEAGLIERIGGLDAAVEEALDS